MPPRESKFADDTTVQDTKLVDADLRRLFHSMFLELESQMQRLQSIQDRVHHMIFEGECYDSKFGIQTRKSLSQIPLLVPISDLFEKQLFGLVYENHMKLKECEQLVCCNVRIMSNNEFS